MLTFGLDDLFPILMPDAKARDQAHRRRMVRKRIDMLIEEDGFPQPVAGLGLVWSRRAVEAWIMRGEQPAIRVVSAAA